MQIVIFGLGRKLDLFLNICSKLGANIVGIVSFREQVFRSIDGIPVFKIDELYNISYDLILIQDKALIKDESIDKTIREKMVDETLFYIPHFDLEKYMEVRKNKWFIISEDCWGGMAYSFLQIPFTSPFININIPTNDYYKMLDRLEYFLKTEIDILRDEDISGYAIGQLGDRLDKIQLDLWHYKNGKDAIEKWKRRLNRVQKENPILIKKTIINDEDAYRFSKLPYKNKIGFYYKPIELEGIICLSGWQDSKIRYDYAWDFKRYVRTMVDLKSKAMLSYPILDLFSDERIECRY